MTVTATSPAPYAPASAILEVIGRYRTRGLPSPITGEVLGRAGVSESLIPRTLQALQTLDLIDDKGVPTNTLETLRLAPEPEYKRRLAEWLNAAYADVLKFIDPATADEVAIRDAFRSYSPIGQQPRMVSLFQGLYAAAGIGPEKASAPRASRPNARTRSVSPPATATKTITRKAASSMHFWKQDSGAAHLSGIPAPLAGLLTMLPTDGRGWMREDRDKFLATFGALLDFCYPIVTAPDRGVADSEAADATTTSAA